MNAPAIQTPTDEDWKCYDAYMADGAQAAAKRLGIPREELIERMMRASTWLRVSGWREAFMDAIRIGKSLADARDDADQRAAFNMRTER